MEHSKGVLGTRNNLNMHRQGNLVITETRTFWNCFGPVRIGALVSQWRCLSNIRNSERTLSRSFEDNIRAGIAACVQARVFLLNENCRNPS
jgi:hypothetical protein